MSAFFAPRSSGFHGGALLALLVQITHLGIAIALLVTRLLVSRQFSSVAATSSETTYDEDGEPVTVTTTATVTLPSLYQASWPEGGEKNSNHTMAQYFKPSCLSATLENISGRVFGSSIRDMCAMYQEQYGKPCLNHLFLTLHGLTASAHRPLQTSASADLWAVVFLSVKIAWVLVFVAQALLFELPSRQRHFTLFHKVRASAYLSLLQKVECIFHLERFIVSPLSVL
jgi:hypothetical protein